MSNIDALELIKLFDIVGEPIHDEICHAGHINQTHIITTADENGTERKYVLQRINTSIFKDPIALMNNIVGVTGFLRKKIEENGGDPERETLTFLKSGDKYYTVDSEGGFWRTYKFVDKTISYNTAETCEMLGYSGYAFGHFQRMLADYPVDQLVETIPNFHNTVSRFNDFMTAVSENKAGRADGVKEEINFIVERADKCSFILDKMASGEIPMRVTHNDTKLNNVLIDEETGKALCVIDLDTIMPGSALYDFGDSVRFGVSSAAEDERDLDKVYFREDMFKALVKGFVEGCDGALTEAELEALPMGAYVITLETGMRFLGDYLNGDTYFAVHREGHNLDRARTQLKLVYDLESKLDRFVQLVKESK